MRKTACLGVVFLLACRTGLCAGEAGLVGHWKFDKPGAQVPDLSGHGHAARLSGGKRGHDDGGEVLVLDGKQQILVSSSPELNLARNFSIEARVRLDKIGDGHTLVFKDNQYSLRVDWTSEGRKISFFVCADQKWEPRVSSLVPEPGRWCHLVATWDGREAVLWLNGEPFQISRRGQLPPPNDHPVVLASQAAHGAGVQGAIDQVKVYRRTLSPAEIICRAYGVQPNHSPTGSRDPVFDFSQAKDCQGWVAGFGSNIRLASGQLVISSQTGRGLALNKNLQADISRRDFLSLRMATDAGSRGEVVFVTSQGAGRIPFATHGDGRPHAYVLEPWTWPGWNGILLALALVPSEVSSSTARIDYVRVTKEPQAEPEIQIENVFAQSALSRAGRPTTILARIRNLAGPAGTLQAALAVPEGVRLQGTATQTLGSLGFLEEREASWRVQADRPLTGDFQVVIRGAGEITASRKITFAPDPGLARAAYVPRPVPARTGKYTLWTHYCPLWKEGTHQGWKAIEPWPERQPILGWYNEGQPEVADWHIKMMLEHGISGMIYCWYRTNKNAPVKQALGHAIHDGLLKARYLPMIRFGIMWENGCGQGCGSATDLVENLLPFWIDNYFSHPSYLKVDGKPVLYIWVPPNVTRDLGGSETVRRTFDRMRAICRSRGLGGLYLVGCVGSQDRKTLHQMKEEGWDASSAYGNGWHQPAQVRTVGDFLGAPFEGFVTQQESLWRFKQQLGLVPDIPSVMMGWDSRPWKETPFFWSDNTPEKFRDLCLRARRVLEANPGSGPGLNTLVFCCWNEFGEGHYIEPTRGYGYSYLDVIREIFGEGPKEHVDIGPEDVGLGPYDSWYQKTRLKSQGAVKHSSWSGEDLAAWSGLMGIQGLEMKGGVLRFTTITNDPALQSPTLKVRASLYSKFVVDMKTSRTGSAQVFWSTSSMPGMSEAASAHAPVPADGQFHRVEFNLRENPSWGGCLTGLRFDPTSAEDVLIEIQAIKLE